MLAIEREKFVAKATLTLAEDEIDFKEKIKVKVEIMMNAGRSDLLEINKEKLPDTLVSLEMERQVHNAWFCAVLEATLTRTLHDENRQRIFSSVDEMKNSTSSEALEKLCDALVVFLKECGFYQTPYFQRLDNYARKYGVPLSTAMEEDDFLVEIARWATHYEKAHEIIGQIISAQVADAPPKKIIDAPQTFRNW